VPTAAFGSPMGAPRVATAALERPRDALAPSTAALVPSDGRSRWEPGVGRCADRRPDRFSRLSRHFERVARWSDGVSRFVEGISGLRNSRPKRRRVLSWIAVNGWVASSVRRSLVLAGVVVGVQVVAPGCSVGDGSGSVAGTLDVPDCWSGNFNLSPDFFAADPYDNSLTIRIQNGSDYASFSDGLSILVDNIHEIRGDAPYSPSLMGRALDVGLPTGVVIAGAPVIPQPDPPLVHITVYLQKSCPTQNVALYALESVSVEADGDCTPTATGPYILQCNATTASGLTALADAGPLSGDAGTRSVDASSVDASGASIGGEGGTILPPNAPVRHSTITFQSLFDGNEDESSAAQRLTQATFAIYLADPRDACPGGLGPPPPCRGFLTGQFQFYFERGRPGQPFP